MGNKIFKKTGIGMLFCISLCYGQGIGCTEINEIKNKSIVYRENLGSIIFSDGSGGSTYQSTFLPAYAKQVIINIDSFARTTSVFFYVDYFKSLENGQASFEKIKKKVKTCLKGYKMLKLEEVEGVMGSAFYKENEDDYVKVEQYWMLGLGKLDLDHVDRPDKFILFLSFIQEWE
jgi:hypothetical protein